MSTSFLQLLVLAVDAERRQCSHAGQLQELIYVETFTDRAHVRMLPLRAQTEILE